MDLDKFRARAFAVMAVIILVSVFIMLSINDSVLAGVLFVYICVVCAPGITYIMSGGRL
jgi:hypothetical protein